MTVYAYYRVSTDKQDYENQKQGVVEFSKRNNMPIEIEIVDDGKSGALAPEKRQLGQLLGILKEGDVIISSEISRISRKLFDLFTIAKYLNDKKTKLYTVKDNYSLDNSIQGQALLFAFGLASQIERDLISQRTREALKRVRESGKHLGRPFGAKTTLKLDKYRDYILDSVDKGLPLTRIATGCNISPSTLRRWLKKQGIDTNYERIKTRHRKTLYTVDYSKSYVTAVNNQLVRIIWDKERPKRWNKTSIAKKNCQKLPENTFITKALSED